MDLSGLVLHDGDRTRGTGRVVAYQGQVFFEPQLPVPLVRYAPGHEPPPRPSGVGVLAHGVDLDLLASRVEKDGGISGLATLTGTWHDEALHVEEQTAEQRGRPRPHVFLTVPPCPPPPTGWPRVPEGSNIEPHPPESIPGRVSVALFRPSPTQVVLVVATSEPVEAEELLRPLYGDALCVVPSRWAPEQVEEVRSTLHRHWSAWGVYEFGNRTTEDGQVLVVATVVCVLPAMAEWSRTLPDGILEVTPWLGPIDRERL